MQGVRQFELRARRLVTRSITIEVQEQERVKMAPAPFYVLGIDNLGRGRGQRVAEIQWQTPVGWL